MKTMWMIWSRWAVVTKSHIGIFQKEQNVAQFGIVVSNVELAPMQ